MPFKQPTLDKKNPDDNSILYSIIRRGLYIASVVGPIYFTYKIILDIKRQYEKSRWIDGPSTFPTDSHKIIIEEFVQSIESDIDETKTTTYSNLPYQLIAQIQNIIKENNDVSMLKVAGIIMIQTRSFSIVENGTTISSKTKVNKKTLEMIKSVLKV